MVATLSPQKPIHVNTDTPDARSTARVLRAVADAKELLKLSQPGTRLIAALQHTHHEVDEKLDAIQSIALSVHSYPCSVDYEFRSG
jgi:hypothetical protein